MLAPGSCRKRWSTCGSLSASPNVHLMEIAAIWATEADMGGGDNHETLTQLDSHANMAVAGEHATVFGHSGKSADVRPFSKDC